MPKTKHSDETLNTPILELEKLYYLNKANKEAALKAYSGELKQREIALYKHYGLERPTILDPQTRQLITSMAKELGIRGFYQTNEVKTSGAPQKWKSYDGALLWARVELKKINNKTNKSLRSIIATVISEYKQDYSLKDNVSGKILKSSKNPDELLLDIIYKRYNEIIKAKPWQIQIAPLLKKMCENIDKNTAHKFGVPATELTEEDFLKDFFIPFCERGIAEQTQQA